MKKLNKFFAILVALAMMAMLAVTSAFAADNDVPTGSATDSYLVKYLEIKEGVTVPDDTFNFAFTGKDGTNTTASDAQAIAPTGVSIKARNLTTSASEKDGGNLVGKINIADLFKSGDKYKFTKPGVYVYEVKEAATTQNSKGKYADNNQVYTLRIYVIDDGHGTYTIDKVTISTPETKTVTDPDTQEEQTVTEEKKGDPKVTDPSVVKGEDETTTELTEKEVEGSLQGFTFLNKYTQATEETPTDNPANHKYGAYSITKAVTGAYGDKNVAFPFTVSVIFPENYNGKKDLTIKYVKDGEATTTATVAGTLNSSGSAGITIKDGYVAYFENLPEDAEVVVTETLATNAATITNAKDYAQTSDLVDNGSKDANATKTGKGEDLASAKFTYKDNKAANRNANDWINHSEYDPGNEGVIVNNLPYIALALVAVGGLVAYVVVRRKADDEA